MQKTKTKEESTQKKKTQIQKMHRNPTGMRKFYKPLGHCATIFPFRDATVVVVLYLVGPMSEPSASLNLSSTKSSLAIDEPPSTNPPQVVIPKSAPIQQKSQEFLNIHPFSLCYTLFFPQEILS